MVQPNKWQWTVLWAACVWTVLALIVAEDYVLRAVFGGWVVAALAYWQFSFFGSANERVRADSARSQVSTARRQRIFPWLALLAVVFFGVTALASDENSDAQALLGAGMFFWWYLLFADCIAAAGRVLRVERRWRAWVPIFQLALLTDVAGVSQGWAVAMMMPLVGFFVHAWLWFRILPRVGMSSTWGTVAWMPFLNAPLLAYVASRQNVARADDQTIRL